MVFPTAALGTTASEFRVDYRLTAKLHTATRTEKKWSIIGILHKKTLRSQFNQSAYSIVLNRNTSSIQIRRVTTLESRLV